MKIKKRESSVFDIISKCFVVLLACCILIPFLWVITSSLKTQREYYAIPIVWISKDPQWQRYYEVFINLKFYRYILNSLILAVVCVVLNVASSAFVSFGFARYRFLGKQLWFSVLLASMLLPAQVTMIPQFILFKTINWLDTYLPLIVPQVFASAFNVLLISQFMRQIPKEIDEAAKIDGCGNFRIWYKIILPQALSVLIVASIFTFLSSWKDSMGPLIYVGDRNLYTVALALMFFQSPTDNEYGLLLTGLVISLIPTVIVYVLAQKRMENGIFIADLK